MDEPLHDGHLTSFFFLKVANTHAVITSNSHK